MRKALAALVIGIAAIFLPITVNAANTGEKIELNTSDIQSGILQVSYASDANKKSKFRIEKDHQTYTYNINNDGNIERFPLQLGDGLYKVSILQNISDNRYKVVYSENIDVDLSDDKDVFLGSVQNINWNRSSIAAKKAAELVKGIKNEKDKINVIYKYIVSNVKYDYDKLAGLSSDYNPDVDTILKTGKGICYDYSSTFAAMLRSIGIPAKLVKGYTPNVKGFHAWNEVYNSSTRKWMVIDTTYDAQMKSGNHKYSMEKSSSQYTKSYEY